MDCIKCKSPLPEGALYCPKCGKKQSSEKKRKSLKRANGTGTVYKLSGRRRKPWAAAKNRVMVGYYETKTEALEALNRLTGREITERYNMTFQQVYDEWSNEHYREVGKKAIDLYSRAYDVFESLHGKCFRQLRTADFQAVIDQHMSKSHSTVSKYKRLLTQMSEWAIREEIITTNFANFVRVPENVKKEKEIFTEEDIAKLEADGSETAKIILMLIYTGMRIGELLQLPVSDYHGTYVIGGEKTESGKNRVIPIRPEGRAYFQYFADNATGDLLLSGYTGKIEYKRFLDSCYYKLLDKLGIDRKTPHSTRHTYATRARRDGMPPDVLQKILGHANYSTTAEIYVHKDVDELVKAVENGSKSQKFS